MAKESTLVLISVALLSTIAFIGLAIWAWGDVSGFFRHPARTGLIVVTVALVVASGFSRVSGLSAGKREDRSNRWIFAPLALLTLALAWIPPYDDRHELWTFDGDASRYTGLVCFAVGGILRVASLFALGHRFSGLVAIQPDHELKTDGLYRVVRHPSYLGVLLAALGWALVFRSVLGVLLAALILVPLIARMNAEERLLLSEFGERYAAYRRRTWRLLPFVY
jgi:protein-S-isoprenylcysteine O-methyltransferase Ste14